jgi:hypothetical protein
MAAEILGQTDRDVRPRFVIENIPVILDPLQITNVPRDVLGPVIASLANEDGRIINALDALLSESGR